MRNNIYLIDLDGVLVHQGTREFLPGSLSKLKELNKKGEIWYFSCWAFTDSDIEWLRNIEGVDMAGFIRKPLGEKYIYIDDKLSLEESNTHL